MQKQYATLLQEFDMEDADWTLSSYERAQNARDEAVQEVIMHERIKVSR